MTKREQRVIDAFINCVLHGEFTASYATTLIEDDQRSSPLPAAPSIGQARLTSPTSRPKRQ